jgi:hypothetical protein
MKPGDRLILDDEIPPPILTIKSVSESIIEFERHDRLGGKKLCMLSKYNLDDFVRLGVQNGVPVFGCRNGLISESRNHELFRIANLPKLEQQRIRGGFSLLANKC